MGTPLTISSDDLKKTSILPKQRLKKKKKRTVPEQVTWSRVHDEKHIGS